MLYTSDENVTTYRLSGLAAQAKLRGLALS